jgi:hypothetical protein
MPNHKITVLLLTLFLYAGKNAISQTYTKTDVLKRDATIQAQKEKALSARLIRLSEEKGWPLVLKGRNNAHAILVDVDALGLPIYLSTEDIGSAATIRTSRLWPLGGLGLSLTGSSNNLTGKLGLWDGGSVRGTHVELATRISQRDVPNNVSDHSTHVAGIMMASGQYAPAKGMAYGLKELACFDFTDHLSEMFTAAQTGMLASNHSYGAIAGWYFNEGQNRWEFWGQSGSTEDYKFGYYSNEAQVWDSIAYNAPNYLIVKSAGNNRDMNGPAVGQPYWRYNSSNVMSNAGNRPIGISSNDGYDVISTYGGAKNVLTVGGVAPIEAGYTRPQDVAIASFSSWGPTDDGRIKPDVVASGVDVVSSVASSDNGYASFNGTSMASPAAAGSVILLQEYYSQKHGGTLLRSASLKGLIIHTADESGPSAGPDYQHGWGLINMEKAASVITSNNTDQLLQETVLGIGQTHSIPVIASGKGTLTATICWTDPKGAVDAISIDNANKKLVNDLDIRIKKGATTYMPWILNPANPSQAASPGDNTLDNVEKIEVFDVVPGQTYTIEVTHKGGTLERGSQAYSLVVSGVGGVAYCASAPTVNAGARIDSVSIGTIKKANVGGCTTYSNFTSVTADVEGNSTIPLFVRLSSCDASNVDKMVKAFIDINNDGDFTDAGELVAQSGVINGNGDFNGNATIPAGLTTGNFAILRIVVVETGNASDVQPCGSYARGETQDYRIRIIAPSNDAGIFDVVSPFSNICPGTHNYVTVRIRNYGTTNKTNIPVTVTIKDGGGNTIHTLNETFKGVLPAFGSADYTLQTPFTALAGTTYTITGQSNMAGDQNTGNDTKVATIVTEGLSAAPTGEAEICNNNSVAFKAPDNGFDVYAWYSQPAATVPLAYGATATSNVITGDKKYYLAKNEQVPAIGPATKSVLSTTGIYNRFNAYFITFTNASPVIIESARMYIGNPSKSGKVTITLARNVTFNANNTSYSYTPEAIVNLDVYATDPTPVAANTNQPYDPTDPGAIFNLNIPVVNPGEHSLIITQDIADSATFLRNSAIDPNPYPVGIPGLFTINSNIESRINPTPNAWQRSWYFFYDMRLRWADCPSARTTIDATNGVPPVITWNGTIFTSSAAAGNQWHLNGNPIPGATGQTYTPNQSGTYKSVVTTNVGCLLNSNEINATVTGIPNIDPAEIGLKVLPNPSDGHFVVDFTVTTRSNLGMRITNMLGQDVWQKNVPNFIGQYKAPVEAGHLAPGIYLLKIHHNNRNYVKKLIIR